jgi:hypothetical protein
MKRWLILGATMAVALAMSLPADALTTPKLHLFTDGSGAEIGWAKGPDSPNDVNKSALNIRTDAGEYAYAYSGRYATPADNGATEIPIADVTNLSFDFLNAVGGGYEGAGAPRLSVAIDENGDHSFDYTTDGYAFLSGSYCDTPTSDPNWSRADFTGQTAPGCSLQYKGVTYTSDGAMSAWQEFSVAFPSGAVDYAFLIVDEQTAPGRARVDRIAMVNFMQDGRGHVVNCRGDETRC